MFGFLRPDRSARGYQRYRQVYARCCRFQSEAYGRRSLVLLSYEAVFLYLLAMDSGCIPPPAADEPLCCRLRRRGIHPDDADAALARYCAACGLLLAETKLEDDVRDAGGLIPRLARLLLSASLRANRSCLQREVPCILAKIDRAINDHLLLERHGGRYDLMTYAEPTARGFGALFAGLGDVVPDVDTNLLEKLGRKVGTAIIAYDSAIDFNRDRVRGHFNPLANEQQVLQACDLAIDQLTTAGWLCNDQLPGQPRWLSSDARPNAACVSEGDLQRELTRSKRLAALGHAPGLRCGWAHEQDSATATVEAATLAVMGAQPTAAAAMVRAMAVVAAGPAMTGHLPQDSAASAGTAAVCYLANWVPASVASPSDLRQIRWLRPKTSSATRSSASTGRQ
jgi:hypothetical protein